MQRRQNCRGGGWTYEDEAYKDKVDVNEEAYKEEDGGDVR
jgi:hypothetical protein